MADATAPLEPTSYRQRVLATLRRSTSLSFDDPFFVVDLDPSVDDDAVIEGRITELVALWNKERSPNYKPLTAQLARRRGELEAVLLDPAARAAARAQVVARRTAAALESYGALDALAAQLVARYQGLPRSRLPQLATVARSKGIAEDAFASWVSRHRVIDDGAGTSEPLSAPVRRQIRAALDELGRLSGSPEQATTLWTFLGVAPSADTARITQRLAELAAANQLRQHDRRQTVTADLLTSVRAHLVNGDPAAYAASLVEDAKDQLRDVVAEKVIVAGELSAADFEACVRLAMGYGYGLSSEQARTAVRQLATGLGASVVTAAAVDYVLCSACREPQPRAGPADCRYCGTALFRDCPSCGRPVEAALVACPQCGVSFRALALAESTVADVRGLLVAGRPVAARSRLLDHPLDSTGSAQLDATLTALRAELDAALVAAEADWRATEAAIADRRLAAAADRLHRLARTASDVRAPDGARIETRLADLAVRKAAMQSELAGIRGLPEAGREAALVRLLTTAVDDPEVLDLLARVPLAPPRALHAELAAVSVRLRWQPAAAVGPVSFRVSRVVLAADGTESDRRVLGTVSSTEFDDGGVAAGTIVRHEVQSVAGRRTSDAVSTTPALVVRDVTSVTAAGSAEGIALRWSPLPAGAVVLERTVDPSSGISAPLRRARGDASGYLDRDARPGVLYHYQVYAEYRDLRGAVVRTPGSRVSARVVARPRAVTDLYAVTTAQATKLSWATPPSGEVRIFAAAGPLAAPDEEVSLAELARRGRFIGAGQRRAVDTGARGLLTYTPITVDGERAVVGTAVSHLAVPAVRELAATDTGTAISLTFTMPPGVTQCYICARRDRFPAGPADPAANRTKVTNTALEIGGGFQLDAPADGGAWYFSVHPLVQEGRTLLAAPVGAQLKVRDAVPLHASYTVRKAGLRRRSLVIEVTGDGPLPRFVAVGKPGAVPVRRRDGTELGRLGGTGEVTARLELALTNLSLPFGVRLFPRRDQSPPRPLTLDEPPTESLLMTQ